MISSSASLSACQAHRLALYFSFHYPAQRFLQPTAYQQLLLDTFVRGELSIDQLLVHLEAHEYEQERKPAIGWA